MNTERELLEGTRTDITIEGFRSNCSFSRVHSRTCDTCGVQTEKMADVSGKRGRGADFFFNRAAGHRVIIIVNGFAGGSPSQQPRHSSYRASKKRSNGTVVRV